MPPAVFIETHPRSEPELFTLLRERGALVSIESDRRLSVRVREGEHFEQVCELLDELDHDIVSLNLAYLPIGDLGPLFQVYTTERLDLTGASASLDPLRYLASLRELSLASTDYPNLAPLNGLDNLELLDLSHARANLVSVGQLVGLRELDLQGARTTPRGFELREGDGLELAAIRNLELTRLDLRHTKVHEWAALAELSTIRTLDLSYTNFADPLLLADFAWLESLELRRTAITDLSVFARLDALAYLDIAECELLDATQIQWLRRARPDLRVVE